MITLLAAAATATTLVFCAPGYPGARGDAQPLVDQFATAVATAAGWPAGSLTAVYDPTEAGGLDKLSKQDAALTFVPYPFYYQHGTQLHLTPLVQADVSPSGTHERWTLVAKPGITAPAAVGGYTLVSVAGYAPDFVRHAALESWGLPAGVKIESGGQILSSLRKIANGEQVIALLDQEQASALPSLPFANSVKPVTQSPDLPVALIAVIDNRLPAARAHELQTALLKLGKSPGAASDALANLHLKGFVMPQLPAKSTVAAP